MKRLLFLLLFVSVISVFAQNTQIYKSATGYDWENGAWAPAYRATNTVDKNGFLINYLEEEWLTNATGWQPQSQTTYTNNTSGQEIQRQHQYWNGGNNTWQNSTVVQITYNANKKITTELAQYLSGGTLTNSYMNSYFYNAKGQLILEEFKNWQSGAWKLASRSSYTNNADGFPSQTLYENFMNDSITYRGLTTTIYFAPGQLSESVSKKWTTSGWVNDNKFIQEYDQFGFLVSAEQHEWVKDAWLPSIRYTITNLSDGRWDFYIGELFNGSTWVNLNKTVFDWSSALVSGISDPIAIGLNEPGFEQPAIYFDFNGRQVEKQKNVLLIEQRGNVRRKVIIQE